MTHSEIKPPHVLFLFSDTGGGHRSAAEAIIEAINLDFRNRISTEMVDFSKHMRRRHSILHLICILQWPGYLMFGNSDTS